MANPRKFSEKIALHTQKQAEETSNFERVIREVAAAKLVCFDSLFFYILALFFLFFFKNHDFLYL